MRRGCRSLRGRGWRVVLNSGMLIEVGLGRNGRAGVVLNSGFVLDLLLALVVAGDVLVILLRRLAGCRLLLLEELPVALALRPGGGGVG